MHRPPTQFGRPRSVEPGPLEAATEVARLDEELEQALAELERAPSAELARTARDLHAAARAAHTEERRRASAGMRAVQECLSRLRATTSTDVLLDRAAAEIRLGLGFDRVNIFRIEGPLMLVERCDFGDADREAEFRTLVAEHPVRLDEMVLETEAVRRRTALICRDVQADPRASEAARLCGSPAYVAAPIMPAGRVVGFLHVDNAYTGRPLRDVDRDALWAFAEGFSFAFEHVALLERRRRDRDRLAALLGEAGHLLDDAAREDLGLGGRQGPDAGGASRPVPAQADGLLTRRERDVLALVATGATNEAIARELVVSVATVKSHVHHILRKLGATNRAQAVSRHLELTAAPRR